MILCLTFVSFFVAVRSILATAGYLRPPFLIAGAIGLWYTPQLWAISIDELAPPAAIHTLALMAIFCLMATLAGWHLGRQVRQRDRRVSRALPRASYFAPVLALTAVSTMLNLLLADMRVEMTTTQWSGPITIVSFFANIRILALGVSLILFFRRPTFPIAVIVAINAYFALSIGFGHVRRTEIAEIGIVLLGAAWFARRWRTPLPALVPLALLFAAFVFSIGSIRGTVKALSLSPTGGKAETVEALADAIGPAELSASMRKAPDVRNAAFSIQLIQDGDDFVLGATLWNGLVHQYVPGQIIGHQIKQALMLPQASMPEEAMQAQYFYTYVNGTTMTGIGSAYRDFWFLGAVYFGVMGWVLARFYSRAAQGDVWFQALYLASTPMMMVSVTHGHDKFFTALPLLMAVTLIARAGHRLLAKRPVRRRFILVLMLPRIPLPRPRFRLVDTTATHLVTATALALLPPPAHEEGSA